MLSGDQHDGEKGWEKGGSSWGLNKGRTSRRSNPNPPAPSSAQDLILRQGSTALPPPGAAEPRTHRWKVRASPALVGAASVPASLPASRAEVCGYL